MDVNCFHCREVNKSEGKPGFRDECLKCRSDLHVCKNCEFYDPKVYNECRETSADVVREKERANFCDFFSPGIKTGLVDEKTRLNAAAEALFKK